MRAMPSLRFGIDLARAAEARAARAEIEAALDATRWPWSRRLSLWLDALVIREESAA